MPQNIYSGFNSYKNIEAILKDIKPKKLFVVTGKNSYHSSNAEKLISPITNKYPVVTFSDYTPNPKMEDIKRAVSIFNENKCDIVVAIGGGSAIDIAKAVSLLATQKSSIERYIEGTEILSNKHIPALMVPTTAGTGSESTHFSVLYIDKVKYSLEHDSMLPEYVVLDPTFTLTLTPEITATTGMDALCQAIESFWSVNSTFQSIETAKRSIDISLENLEKCVNAPDNSSRENMLIASNLSGQAINVTKTTAPHALSYPLTSFFNIPHGHAVALTLPYFFEYNYNVDINTIQDKRGTDFVKKTLKSLFDVMSCKDANDSKNKILTLMGNIGLKTRLSDFGIKKNDIETIIRNGFDPSRIKNNPRIVDTIFVNKILNHLCN